MNPVTNRIYVANLNPSSDFSSVVTVINGADNTFTSLSDPNAATPYAVAVNPVTNKIYVPSNSPSLVNDNTEDVMTVIDGATNSVTDVIFPNAYAYPAAVAVNEITNTVYVADSAAGDGTDEVIPEQQVQSIPILSSITALPGNLTASLTPAFSFTASNSLTLAPIDNLLYQVDTWQAPWLVGASQGGGNFNGTAPALQPGMHILYAYSTDGEEATSTNTGVQSSPLIGSITAYPFLVAAPEASLSMGTLVFSNQAVGTNSTATTVTLTNSGTAPLTIASVGLSGTNPNDFIESDNCVSSSPLAPAATCTVDLTFRPTAVGASTAAVVVTDNSGDVNGSQQTINLTGTGIQASTATIVVSSANPSVYGQLVTFVATVTPEGLGTPTGTVTFKVGATAICGTVSLSGGQGECPTANLTVGPHFDHRRLQR